jgi:hypothetical protein
LALITALVAVASYARKLADDTYLSGVADTIFVDGAGDEQNCIALMHYVHKTCARHIDMRIASATARFEGELPLGLTPVTILKEGSTLDQAPTAGFCGAMSRVMVALAWQRGIPARRAMVEQGGPGGNHSMAALWIDGGWRLFDPSIDFTWTNKQGHVATIDEIRADPNVYSQVYVAHSDYRYRFERMFYFRWSRLGVAGRVARRALVGIKGEPWVQEMGTPVLYDRPMLGYACFFGAASFFFAGWAWDGRRRRRKGACPPTESDRGRLAAHASAKMQP